MNMVFYLLGIFSVIKPPLFNSLGFFQKPIPVKHDSHAANTLIQIVLPEDPEQSRRPSLMESALSAIQHQVSRQVIFPVANACLEDIPRSILVGT